MSDLLPNDSTYFLPQRSDEQQANAERGKTLEAYPLIESVIEWFELQAKEAEKITSINLDSKIPVESQVLAMQEVAALLRTKKGDLEILVEEHVKNRKK